MSRALPYAANRLLEVRLPANRSNVMLLLLAGAFVALAGRAVWLQWMSSDFLQRQGESRYGRTIEMPASRGKVLDRNGNVLATSLPASAVWAEPEDFEATPQQLAKLSKLIGVSEAEIRRRVDAANGKTFVYLKRQVEPEISDQVTALDIPGVHLRKEYKRHYPENEALAHVIGFTNVEDVGQEGIELAQEPALAGRPGSRRVIRDRLGRTVEDRGVIREPLDGRELQLSIDSKVQYQAFAALRDAVALHHAKAGAVIVVDVRTGEVLALANLPTYNPNQRGQLSGEQLRNRVITDTFEPGSTFKPFTIATALEAGTVTPQTIINTAPGKMTIGSATIGDAHAHGALSIEQVIQVSSNIGTAKVALQLPSQRMWETFTAAGFGQAPSIGFPGAVAGRVRPYRNWKPIEQATMSYGHGLSVSLVQLARAYTIFARDGDIVPLTMLKTDGQVNSVPVLSPKTARSMRVMLEMAAGPGGTAPKAQVRGYRVAGKTGTAMKLVGGRYANKYVSSFVGFAPVSDPRIVVAVMIDEPTAGGHYGGTVAAPVFSQIAGETLRTLRVTPDAPMNNTVIPDEPVVESM